MKRILLAVGLTFFLLCLGSCGGSGGGGGQGGGSSPTSSTITSVSVACNPTSVQNGQTSQCSATVSGTGSYSSAVTWSTDLGTIDTSGKYTAPTSGTGTATVKAISQQDGTKSGSATITVTAQTSQTALSPTGPMAVPSILVCGQQTQVTITDFVQGSDASTQVQLFSLVGGTPTLIGNMNDNGQNGDQTARDHLYTIVTALTPPAAASLPLQVVATEGTTSSQNVDFSVPLIQIPTYATNTDVNQAEAQIYNTAIQTRTSFANMDWTSSSQQQAFVNDLNSMFRQLTGVMEQNTALRAAAQLRQSNVLTVAKWTSPQQEGILQSILGSFYPVLGATQNAESCDQLMDSIPGNPDYGSTSYPFSMLSPDNPNMQAFAQAMATASQGLFLPQDFLTNDSSSYRAYIWVATRYMPTHQLSPAIGGCGAGIAQSVARVGVMSDLGQYTDLAGNGLSDLVGGGEISQQLVGQTSDILVGWAADSSGKPTVMIGQAGADQTFAAPAGNYNLAASFGGDTANGTITNTPVYPKSVTDISPSPGANVTVTPPYITGLTPTLGLIGTVVSVTGSGFDTTPSGNHVAFNGTAAQVSTSTASSIETSVPAGASSGPVTVATSSGSTTSSIDFAVDGVVNNPVPAVASLSPTSAAAGSTSQTVTITGSNFMNTSSINFNGSVRTPVFVSSTELTLDLTAVDLATTGTFPVSVTNPSPGGGTSNVIDFTVTTGSAGSVTISPTSVTVPEEGAQTFTASVAGSSKGVKWSVQEGTGGGTITWFDSSEVIYLPPSTTGTYHVVATSVDAPTQTAAATVTVTPALTLTVLHSFQGLAANDGSSPYSGLIQANNGDYYGTTMGGDGTVDCGPGSDCGTCLTNGGCGTIFSVDASGNLTLVHSFSGGDGEEPMAGLVQGRDGDFYGTTGGGGALGYGTIFKMDASGNLTTLHSFSESDGANPYAPLIQAADGDFYGTTSVGGPSSNCYPYGGCGTIFKIDASGNFTLLHLFSGPDGALPHSGLIQAQDGNFYGVTSGNATFPGTVFKMDPSGKVTVLHSFTCLDGDGCAPYGSLLQASDGSLYGTTSAGGAFNDGTIYKIDTSGNFTILHSFSGPDGSGPEASLIQAGNGDFYGTTWGGASNDGTIFRMDASGNVTVLHSFSGTDGSAPFRRLVLGTDGNLYGTTMWAGPNRNGVVFRLNLVSSTSP